MTFISQYAKALRIFLQSLVDNGFICKFKIYWRIGFLLDIYVVTDNYLTESDLRSKFFKDYNEKLLKDDSSSSSASERQMCNIQILFNIISSRELAEEEYFNDINNNPNSIDYGPRYRFDSLLDSSEIVVKEKKINIPVITFYSYKGGVGRTTTMISYALHLAKKRKKVAVIDCDLEAPGYINFFNLSKNPKLIDGKKNGLIEFICDSQFLGETVKIKDYIFKVGEYDENSTEFPELNNIWIIPAGNLNEGAKDTIVSQSRRDYLEGMAKINFGDPQTVVDGFDSLFEQLVDNHFDAILIDSRTGFNDIFGTTAWHLSSCVVGFFGLSRQTEPGFTNLLAEHSEKRGNAFKLILAFSILPNNVHAIRKELQEFIDRAYNEKEHPVKRLIHRNALLESIGTGDRDIERKYIDMCTTDLRERQFLDYTRLFSAIDDTCFFQEKKYSTKDESNQINENDLYSCKDVVLQQIEKAMYNAAKPAEDSLINAKTFFYRECMGDFFKKEKIIIYGRRGTGKTCLYKAIRNNLILNKIKDLAKVNDNDELIFINALPASKNGQSQIKKSINHVIDDKNYDPFNFWRINTWAKLLLDNNIEELSEIQTTVKKQSPLAKKFHLVNETLEIQEILELMNNVDSLLQIVEDLHRFNEKLKQTNKKVFVLYDGLNSCISTRSIDTALISLLNYWKEYETITNNIIPKIFIRTDLCLLLNEGFQPSSRNTLNLEWSIEEVFGYFFKQVFSDSATSEKCWILAKELCTDSQYISYVQKVFEENNNQFNILSQAEMEPLVQVFFGKSTERYGSPWDYFRKETSNADYSANLQAFINILNKNAVKAALASAETDVTEIISPSIYTATDVRQLATQVLFENMTHGKYNKVLIDFQNIILRHKKWLGYKSLNDEQFEALIDNTYRRQSTLDRSLPKKELILLIFANGIMNMVHTTKGNVYRFAPLYWFSWGLQDEKTENDDIVYISSLEKLEGNEKIDKNKLDSYKQYFKNRSASVVNLAAGITENMQKIAGK
ncbi:MAG: AAA family ATPase [Fibrobacter sp.]|nr:AAA family ATPase [Fibrobacter sp.]